MFPGIMFPISYFTKLFLREGTAQLTWFFTSGKQKCLHFNVQGLLVSALWDDMLSKESLSRQIH